MKNQDTFKRNTFSAIVVFVTVIFDGLSMLLFGIIYLIGAGNADFIDFEIKKASLLQGEIVAGLAFIYFLVCCLSLDHVLSRSRVWSYVILGLGMMHFVGASCLLLVASLYADSIYPLPYGSLVVNLLLLTIFVYETNKSKSPATISNA